VLTYHTGELNEAGFPARLQALSDLVAQIPQHVWDDYARR
jgi:hypothetical protein